MREKAPGVAVDSSEDPRDSRNDGPAGEAQAQDDERVRNEILKARVARLIRRLQSNPTEAGQAFRELWEVKRELIPALVREVENATPSALRELQILVVDTARFAEVDPSEEHVLTYRIPGMGDCAYDDIAAGPVPKGYRVKLTRYARFPVGVVIRAGLINRFRSKDYPRRPDDHLVVWWMDFYRRVAESL